MTINPTTITLAVIALLVLVSWLTGRLWPLSVLPLALVAVVIVVRSFLGRERAEATYGLPKQRVAVEASATDVAAGQTVRVKRCLLYTSRCV